MIFYVKFKMLTTWLSESNKTAYLKYFLECSNVNIKTSFI